VLELLLGRPDVFEPSPKGEALWRAQQEQRERRRAADGEAAADGGSPDGGPEAEHVFLWSNSRGGHGVSCVRPEPIAFIVIVPPRIHAVL